MSRPLAAAELIAEASEGRADRPSASNEPVSAEDFAAWCEHPVTRFVAASHELMAQLQQTAWLEASWGQGVASELTLAQLKVRADTFLAFTQSTWADHAARLAERGDGGWWRFVQQLARDHAAKDDE